jgi:hypothetical protein
MHALFLPSGVDRNYAWIDDNDHAHDKLVFF